MDLDEELAAGRYGWLLDRILDLPDPYSRFREAMSEDEEMAALLLELEETREEEDGPSATLRYSQVGLREHVLMSIDMNIKALRAEAPFAAGNAKGKPVYPESPWPLPVTAIERLRRDYEKEQADTLASGFGVPPEDL